MLALLPLAAFAQKPVLAIQAGATYSNLRGNEEVDKFKYDINFLVGVSMEVPLSEKVSFLTNLNYERKTAKKDVNIYIFNDEFDPMFEPPYKNVTERATLSYISVPIDIRYYFGSKKNIYINAGPTISFYIDDVFTFDGEVENEYSGESDFKALDFGANLGIGMKFPLGSNTLFAELRDNLGLTNIADMPIINDGSIKTNSFNLIVGFEF